MVIRGPQKRRKKEILRSVTLVLLSIRTIILVIGLNEFYCLLLKYFPFVSFILHEYIESFLFLMNIHISFV